MEKSEVNSKTPTKILLSKIKGHPLFSARITGLDLQELQGAEFILNSDSSAYAKKEQREYLFTVWDRLTK